MSLRRRAAVTVDTDAFYDADSDQFTTSFFGEPLFPSQDAARKAWPEARRAVWARESRGRIPRAAEVFDGLTCTAPRALTSAWGCTAFPLRLVLDALAEDRDNLAVFRRTAGAKTIGDYLDLFAADLRQIESLAHQYAAADRHHQTTKHPHSALPWAPYGEAACA